MNLWLYNASTKIETIHHWFEIIKAITLFHECLALKRFAYSHIENMQKHDDRTLPIPMDGKQMMEDVD